MKKTYLAKLAIVSFTVVAAFAFMGTGVQAATGTIASTVSIATPITIVGDSDLVFGVFTAPSSGSETWTIGAASGDISTGTSDGVDLFTDDHSRGLFTISGENGAAVTYSVARTSDFTDAGLSLTTVSWTSTLTSLDSSGELVVGVGGTVTIQSTAGSGGDTAEITLTANY